MKFRLFDAAKEEWKTYSEYRQRRDQDLYQKCYGEEFLSKYEKDKKQRKQIYYLLLALLVIAIVFSGIHTVFPAVKVTYGKHGEITSIERPTSGSGAKSVRLRIAADNGIESEGDIRIEEQGAVKSENDAASFAQESEESRMKRMLAEMRSDLNADTKKQKISLPKETEDGTKVSWYLKKKNDLPMILFAILALGILVFQSQRSHLIKKTKTSESTVVRELPGFLNKVVLLLNAGVVFPVAFDRIAEGYAKAENENYFYGKMREISRKSKETNAAVQEELLRFSAESGVREMMRVATIISDNLHKGSELSEKLYKESRQMWFLRKSQSEEQGRIAETKMTLPLMILLLVLILVAVAPALLSM